MQHYHYHASLLTTQLDSFLFSFPSWGKIYEGLSPLLFFVENKMFSKQAAGGLFRGGGARLSSALFFSSKLRLQYIVKQSPFVSQT